VEKWWALSSFSFHSPSGRRRANLSPSPSQCDGLKGNKKLVPVGTSLFFSPLAVAPRYRPFPDFFSSLPPTLNGRKRKDPSPFFSFPSPISVRPATPTKSLPLLPGWWKNEAPNTFLSFFPFLAVLTLGRVGFQLSFPLFSSPDPRCQEVVPARKAIPPPSPFPPLFHAKARDGHLCLFLFPPSPASPRQARRTA